MSFQQAIAAVVGIALLAVFAYRGYVRAPHREPISSFPLPAPYWVDQSVLFYSPSPVGPGAEARISSRCPNTFYGLRLAIPDHVHAHFALCDVLFGDESQRVNVPPSQRPAFCFRPVVPGEEITFIVRNTSPDPRDFNAAFIGRGEVA